MANSQKYRKLTVEQRAEIGTLAKRNPKISTLAAKYQCTRATVGRWLKEGLRPHPNYSNQRGQGRKRKLTAQQEAKIRQRIVNKRAISIIRARLRLKSDRKPSTRTLARVVKRGRVRLGRKLTRRGKYLTAGNLQARLRFCKRNKTLSAKKCVFLDAKFLYMYNDNRPNQRYAWQRLDLELVPSAPATPTVWLFYAAVAYGHKSQLIFVSPTPPPGSKKHKGGESFKSQHFVAMMQQLKPELDSWFPGHDYVILRDHAQQHLSKLTTAQLAGLNVPWKKDFPAKSWDLNVIETVWGLLDQQLQGKRAKDNDKWRELIQKAWASIKQSSIDKLVLSLPERMQQLIKRGGKWPKKKP